MMPARKDGFTLLELLVALAILGMIVVMCGRIFEQANVSWATGSRKAESNMVGRGLADFIAQDISRCVEPTPSPITTQFNNSTPSFLIIDEAGVDANNGAAAIQFIQYDFSKNPMTRSVTKYRRPFKLPFSTLTKKESSLVPKDMIKGVEITPHDGYVDVTVSVYPEPGNTSYSMDFKTRAWLANRDRYSYDE